jgi:hypothetical protein
METEVQSKQPLEKPWLEGMVTLLEKNTRCVQDLFFHVLS